MKKLRVEVGDILPLALTLVVAGIGIAFGIDVVNNVRGDVADCTTAGAGYTWDTATESCTDGAGNYSAPTNDAYNATTDTITGVAKFSDKMGLIATVIVAAIVIGLLVRFLFMR